MIHLFFCRTICGSANSSELVITAPVDDQYFGHKFEYMLARDKHNHDNTNNKSVQSEILENQLYEVLLYKKMEVLAIQERLVERNLGINDNTNQIALNQSKKAEILDYTSRLLFDLVEKIISIEEVLEIGGHQPLIHYIDIEKILSIDHWGNFHLEKNTICFYIWKRI